MTQESIQSFGNVQGQIWGTVGVTVSESVGAEVTFASPKTDYVPPTALFAETTEPKVVIQFSFSDMPENTQLVLIRPDTVLEIASGMKGEGVAEVTEALVGELRPAFEAFVQGICVAVGKLHNGAVVASGLSIRFLNPAFPPNIQSSPAVFSTSVELGIDEHKGRVVWLADADTARMVLGIEPEDEEAESIVSRPMTGSEESLEILMDIPLQISVELGRVKMVVKDVVELGSGSIIEIDKAAGEPVDVLVNGKVVARGEVVVIEDNFGVRITEILSQQDRLAKLREAA